MLYFPERIAKGDVPNVDFLHLYGPGSLHVLAGWYGLFGTTLAAERTFGLLQHLGIIFGLFTLARAWGRRAATAVGALAVFYVLTPIGLTAMAWNGGVALALWSVVFAVRAVHLTDPARPALGVRPVAGVLAGLALTYRPDLVLALGAGARLAAVARTGRACGARCSSAAVVGLLPMWRAPRHRRARRRRSTGHGPRPRRSTCAPGASCPARRRWAHLDGALQADRRGDPAVVAAPPPRRVERSCSCGSSLMLVGTVGLLGVRASWLRRPDRSPARSPALLVGGAVQPRASSPRRCSARTPPTSRG